MAADTLPLMDANELVPVEVRRRLSSALIDWGTSATQIGQRLFFTDPVPGSDGAHLFGTPLRDYSALGDISLALAAGTDQFHAFARVLRLDEQFGPSLAVLVRSCVESLGRGWWILQADDSALMAHRAAAMELDEVASAVRLGYSTKRIMPNGQLELVEDPVAEVKSHYEAVRVEGVGKTVPGYTQLAVDLLAAAGAKNPRLDYSHLSGAAHGERTTVAALGVLREEMNGDLARFALGLSHGNANTYCWIATNVLDVFMTRLIDLWGIEAERERWVATTQRSAAVFMEVFGPGGPAPSAAAS